MPLPPTSNPTPGLTASGLDIIKGAMRAVNILSSSRNPTSDEANDYLAILNQFLDACNAERLMVFTIPRLGPFNLTVGVQTFTLGPGGFINIPRPARVQQYSIIWLGNPLQPTEIAAPEFQEVSEAGWAAIPVKNLGAQIPQKIWDDQGFPLRTLNFWPFPTTQVQLVVYPWQALNFFPDLATKLSFPPGYLEFLRYNLAVRLDNAEITPQVEALAEQSKMRIKSMNQPMLTLQTDTELLDPRTAAYNWLADVPVNRGYRS